MRKEERAENAIESLARMLSHEARVLRGVASAERHRTLCWEISWRLRAPTGSLQWIGVFLALLLQFGFTYLPFMNTLFGSAPLPAALWLEVLLISFLVIPVVSIHKLILSKKR
jgi:hypothetical protein